MYELFRYIWYIIYQAIINPALQVITDPALLESYCNIISSVLTGVIAIIGIGYIKPLKDKTISATYNFWSQLRVRLLMIDKCLKQDCGLLDNLYSPESKKDICILAPDDKRINEFKAIVNDTLNFIENSNDQMPVYIGWGEDYTQLISYLQDMIVYDICKHDQFFLFKKPVNESQRKEYCKKICTLIEKICTGIASEQSRVEKQIFKISTSK